MENIEEKILRYPDLSPEERDAVDAYVAEHPRWQALLRDVKALEHLLAQARSFRAGAPPSAETLAHYLMTTPRAGTPPPALKAAFDDIEAALEDEEHSDELRARLEALTSRLNVLEAENRDPAAHFEALTGHTLAGERSDVAETTRSEESAQERRAEAPTQQARRTRRAVQFWAFLRLAALPPWARYGAAFMLVLAVLYGGLFAGGRLARSDMERLAALGEDRLSVEGYGLRDMRTRGGGGGSLAPTDSTSLDARYLRSLRLLRRAHTSTLGLFPRYDEATARRAEKQLEAISREAEGGSFLQLEALFFLGKARLALGDKAGATRALRQVVTGGGRLAPEAQEILTALYEDGAYEDGAYEDGAYEDGPPAGE